jgi:hypothetical protein
MAFALVTAGCASPSDTAGADRREAESGAEDTIGPLPEGPSALVDRFSDEFPDPLVDPAAIRSGGPPPDGIPPIDDPQFVTVAEADAWLSDTEPVLLLDIDGDERAYPVQILIWHEIVNDTVGGVPVAITYCPLCNSAITFERTVRGVETTFGTSGSLYNANLVMYDRATETLWNQLDGRAVVGMLAGDVLTQISAPMMAWGEVRETNPDAVVLDRDRTGVQRDYGRNPYTGLDNPDGRPFLFPGDVDVRTKAMQRVVALEHNGEAAAWTLDVLADAEAAVTSGSVGGDNIVIFWKAGQASALEQADVSAGRDVGTVAVFFPSNDGQALEFAVEGDEFTDVATGSTWNILGQAESGELAGTELEPVVFVRTFWFSWSTFRPDTELHAG